MRVSLVTETYFPQVNGVSRTLSQLARHLESAGDAVQLIHPDYGTSESGDDDYLARSISIPFYRELHMPVPPFAGVRHALERFRPDIVHVATEGLLGLSVLRYCRRHRVPVVSSFHTNFDQYSDHYGVGFIREPVWRYLRWFHNNTLETYVPSRATIAELEARRFDRLTLWPRGVDSQQFRPDRPGRWAVRAQLGIGPGDVVIAHVGRLAAEKNVAYLADALRLVAEARPQARILFVGDGPERADLERRMGGLGRFVGYKTGDALADHYAAADLFAFTSRTETFGNVVLEALASGLPVVALRAGGVGEIVSSGETGELVGPDATAEEFIEPLLQLIDGRERRLRLSANARAYAEGQTWNAIMESLRERYSMHVGEKLLV